MGSLTRRVKRNIAQNKYGVRACTEKGLKKKLALLEDEIVAKTKQTVDAEGGSFASVSREEDTS